MNIQSRNVCVGLTLAGLLSYTACTAEKAAMKNQDLSAAPGTPTISQAATPAPKVIDGVYASNDHLQPVYFGLNQSVLQDSAKEILMMNAEWLKSQPPFLIRIVGYADNRGSLKKNERLAERRAQAVREAYVTLGLPKERLSLVGKGTEDPACQPTTEECLSKSRRSETLIEDKSIASR